MTTHVENGVAPADPSGATGADKPARPLMGWATVMALALTALAALGFLWLRERRVAERANQPAEELRHRLDINTASAEELDLLPGVGAFRAQKIIETRQARGGFKRLDELDEPGLLGPGSALRLAPFFKPLPGEPRPGARP